MFRLSIHLRFVANRTGEFLIYNFSDLSRYLKVGLTQKLEKVVHRNAIFSCWRAPSSFFSFVPWIEQ